jgi:hypothetical protein
MKPPTIAILLLLLASTAVAAEKTEVIQKSFPSRPGKVVLVSGGPLDVHVRASDIPDIRVNVELVAAAFSEKQAKAWIDAHLPTLEDAEGQLRITAPDPSGVSLFKGVLATRARIEIVVPPNACPDLSTSSGTLRAEGEYPEAKPLRLRSASGDIEFAGWAPELEARSTSGGLQLRAGRTIEKLLARSASGSVELTGGARKVTCDTSSGSVHLSALLGPAAINTTSGNVVAKFDALAAGDEVRITTSSGKVRVTLPPGTEPGGELASTKGEIRSTLPGLSDPKTIKLELSGKGPKLFVTTTSGKIELL